MMLSLANALLLIFTLLWSVLGIIEFRVLMNSYRDIKGNFKSGSLNKNEYKSALSTFKFRLTINISYLFIVFHLGFVIYDWNELNI